jgi:hypothetical protein
VVLDDEDKDNDTLQLKEDLSQAQQQIETLEKEI